MPQTIVVAETCRVHRFASGDRGVLVQTVMWCPCGLQHPVTRTVHSCACGFIVSLPVGGGHV